MSKLILILIFIHSVDIYAKGNVLKSDLCSEFTPLSSYIGNSKKTILSLEDKVHEFTVESFAKNEFVWNQVSLPLQLGFSESTHWVCLNFFNDTNLESYYLENTVPYVDHVEIFQFLDNQLVFQEIDGDKYPLRNSPFSHYPNPLFQLNIPKTKLYNLDILFSKSILFPSRLIQMALPCTSNISIGLSKKIELSPFVIKLALVVFLCR